MDCQVKSLLLSKKRSLSYVMMIDGPFYCDISFDKYAIDVEVVLFFITTYKISFFWDVRFIVSTHAFMCDEFSSLTRENINHVK